QSCWMGAGEDRRGFAAGHLRAVVATLNTYGQWLPSLDRTLKSSETSMLADLAALGTADTDYRFTGDLIEHVAGLPIMALEALRTAMQAPQLVGLGPETLIETGNPAGEHDVQAALAEIGKERLALLAGFGLVLGADLLGEGTGSPKELASALRTYL